MKEIKACIFDLDGVIVDTAKYHFLAWRRLSNSVGFDFSEEENEQLKGVSRMDSLDLILKWAGVEMSQEEKLKQATQKNEWYLEYVRSMPKSDTLPFVVDFLQELRSANIAISLGSASKNAATILDKLELTAYFDAIVDGRHTTRGKPDPQVFLLGAERLNVAPENCVVFEDAPKGVQAALNANMLAIGVGEQEALSHAHHVIQSFEEMSLEALRKLRLEN